MLKKLLATIFKNSEKNKDYFVLGHMVKYNIYLLSKSVIFASLLQKHSEKNLDDTDIKHIAELTEVAIKELDLASKTQ
jgi:hypothetical protein